MGTIFLRCSCFPFIMCQCTRSSAAPHGAKKCPQTRQKIFKKIYSGFRVFAYRVRKARPRQRNATRPPPAAQARPADGKRQNRANAQSVKNGYMENTSMYSTNFYGLERNSKRREVTAQREREGLRLTLKLSQAGCGYYPERSLRTMVDHSVTYAVYYSAVQQILEAHCMDLCPCGCSPLMVRSLWNGMANGRSWKMDRMS